MRYGANRFLATVLRRATDASSVRGAWAEAATLMASIRQTPGREAVEAGAGVEGFELVVRLPVCPAALTVTTADRLSIAGRVYAIRNAGLPERRGNYVELSCTPAAGV